DVQITFGPPPTIIAQPQNQVALEGENAQFSVIATGDPNPTFIWQRQPRGTSVWVTVNNGADYGACSTPTLVLNATTASMDGYAFRCVLTNSGGGFNCPRPALLTGNRSGVGTLAGQPGHQGQANGLGQLAQFNTPMGIAVDATGNCYVADSGNHIIRKITPN